MQKTVIGLTGGIASGKSTVSFILKREGCRILDCDQIARQVVEKGQPALDELSDVFGKEILAGDGSLDRKKLAEIVFGNTEYIEKLNAITHKYITDLIIKEVEWHKQSPSYDILVIDAPLPIHHGFLDQADQVWVVTAREDTRIRRIQERNGITAEEALNRIRSQLSEEEYLKIADRVIYNNSGVDELEKTVKTLLEQVRQCQSS